MQDRAGFLTAGKTIGKIVLYWIAFVVLYWVTGNLLGFIPAGPQLRAMANWVAGTTAALFITWLFLAGDKKTFASIGLKWEPGTPARFFKGVFTGACIFSLLYGLLLRVPGVTLEWNAWQPDAWTLVGYLSINPLGYMEEVAFRSYSFIHLEKSCGLRMTQLLTATGFALYHVSMGWSWQMAFLGPFAWSFVFGLAAAWSRGIAVPAGIHITINMLQNASGLTGGGLICHLHYSGESAAAAQRMGIFLQLALLAGGVMMTEYFIRRRQQISSVIS